MLFPKKSGCHWLPWWLGSGKSPADTGDVGSTSGQEDPLEKETANHSSILAWGVPWAAELGGLQSMQRDRHN